MVDSNLVKRSTLLKARLNRLNTSFGIVQYRRVVLRMKTEVLENNLYVAKYEDLELLVTPKVENIEPSQIGKEIGSNVFLGNSDYKVTIVRNIDIPDFDYLIIDPIFDIQNKIIGGIKCKLLHKSENSLFDWILYVRTLNDNKNI